MSHDAPAIREERFEPGKASGALTLFLALAVVGLAATALGAFVNRAQFAHSYLFAFFYFFCLSAGSLFWILVHHGTDAEWSVVVRRVLETKAAMMPVFALLFLPLLWVAPILWEWWTIPPGKDHLLAQKAAYLNHTFFYIRAAAFIGLMSLVAFRLRHWSTAQDADGDHLRTIKMRWWTFAGLPIFGVSLSFAAIDWVKAMDHHWFSTMFPVYIFAGAAGSSMALLVLTTLWLKSKGYLKVVTVQHYHIMGKFLLAFTVFWAYIGFSQYMLIWYANIPEETIFFVRRNTETWYYLSQALVVLRFFLPFPFLLFQGTKKNLKVLAFWAGYILVMQALDLYILILPMLHYKGVALSWMDLSAFIGIGGLVGFLFLKALGKYNLFPLRDPRVDLSVRTTN